MIDPNFDPLEHLEICEIEILKLKHDLRVLIAERELERAHIGRLISEIDALKNSVRELQLAK